ncbi:MAG: RNA methyltransferase [Oscillospiraceae bacterium]
MVISSRENPHVQRFKKLISSAKFRREEGLFVIEGARAVADAAAENAALVTMLLTEEAAEKYGALLNFNKLTAAAGGAVYTISEQLAAQISGTERPQGVFAAVKTLDKTLSADTMDSSGKYLLLNRLQDPGNLGTILRTADAVGISGVIMTRDCCDLYNPKAVRATMGSLFRLAIFTDCDYGDALSALTGAGLVTYAAVVGADAADAAEVRDADFSRPCAVVIGNEGAGLSAEEAALCAARVTIRMNGTINSLNASAAAAIILWEMFR